MPKALSDKTGTTTFYLVNNGSGLNTIDINQKNNLNVNYSYMVETTTLDDMIRKFGLPDFLKIDVEGHELSVLKGLKDSVKNISFEANIPLKRFDAIECISQCTYLNKNYKFNYGYDYGLNSNNWLDEKEIIEFLKVTKEPFFNIYCKLFC